MSWVRYPRRLARDHEPGFYYVSIVDGNQVGLLLGPFRYHRQARRFVQRARKRAVEVNDWAWFYSFGTLRLKSGERVGILNADLGIFPMRKPKIAAAAAIIARDETAGAVLVTLPDPAPEPVLEVGMHPQSTCSPEPPQEEWRSVPGFPAYEVSSIGRVRRCEASQGWRCGRIIRPHRNSLGYDSLGLYRSGRQITVNVHRLVCEAFHGPPPGPGFHAAHENGNPSDNRVCNLSWKTPAENQHDKARHGTLLIGEKHGMARLTEGDILELFRLRASGLSLKQIQARTGVDYTHISEIIRRQSWSHVAIPEDLIIAAQAFGGKGRRAA